MANTSSLGESPIVNIVRGTTSLGEEISDSVDLMSNILSRLSLQTLINFKLVRKSWRELITSPRFIYEHINRSISLSNKNGVYKFLITPTYMPSIGHSSYYLIHEDTNTNAYSVEKSKLEVPVILNCWDTYTVEKSKLEVPFVLNSWDLRIIGSVNGLICVSEAYQKVHSGLGEILHHPFGRIFIVWNPSLRKYRRIESSCQFSPPRIPPGDLNRPYIVAGFGFHEPHNDYKIVRILYNEDDLFGVVKPKVEIYSLISNSWTKLEDKVPPRLANYGQCVHLNGSVYWLEDKKDRSPPEFIISFDFKDEAFGQEEIPVKYKHDDGRYRYRECVILMELKGLLAVCTLELEDGGTNQYSTWVMKETCWTKQHEIALHLGPGTVTTRAQPLTFTKGGKLVFVDADGNINVLWDPETQQYICLSNEDLYTVDTSYMESLIVF